MASFKEIKFYFLVLIGLIISIIAIIIFFSTTFSQVLLNLGEGGYAPDFITNLIGAIPSNTIKTTKTVTFKSTKDIQLNVAVADSEKTRQKGLMGITKMSSNQGMLFVFQDKPLVRNFWMKDTKLPLDIMYLSDKKKIVKIEENLPICTKDPCKEYSSETPILYVIEVNAGWVKSNNIQIGTVVDL